MGLGVRYFLESALGVGMALLARSRQARERRERREQRKKLRGISVKSYF
jgi:hypothetical protein